MPRIGQYKNVLLALCMLRVVVWCGVMWGVSRASVPPLTRGAAGATDKPPYGGFPEFLFPPRSHAYFPRDLFDEVEIDHLTTHGWVFGRAGDGYIAL